MTAGDLVDLAIDPSTLSPRAVDPVPAPPGQRVDPTSLMAFLAMMFFWISVAPAPIEV